MGEKYFPNHCYVRSLRIKTFAFKFITKCLSERRHWMNVYETEFYLLTYIVKFNFNLHSMMIKNYFMLDLFI